MTPIQQALASLDRAKSLADSLEPEEEQLKKVRLRIAINDAIAALRSIKPATDEEMAEAALRVNQDYTLSDFDRGFRAAEKLHGIGE